MKKKQILVIAAAIVLLGVLYCCLQPRPIIQNVDLFSVHRVWKTLESGELIDITKQLDLDFLRHTLAAYQCSRVPTSFAPYPQTDVAYEISGIYDGKPIHILVGTINLVYSSSDQGGYQIKSSDALLTELSLMLA